MSLLLSRTAEFAYPYRWWMLACVFVGPPLWMLGVRYLLTLPGFISADTDWFLLKFTSMILAWPWGFFLVAIFFHPVHGRLRYREHSPLISGRRAFVVGALILVFLTPLLIFVAPL
jgi:hypothetical protein